jgi:hypothetical protein
MSSSLERCTNALDDLRLQSLMNTARGAFVMVVQCDGAAEQLEFIHLLNLLLADKRQRAAGG